MEKKNKYYDLLSSKEEKSTFLGLANYGLVFLCIIFLIIIFKISTAPKPVYYVPGATQSGVAYPNQIPDEAIKGFGLSYTLTRANFTPNTIRKVLNVTYKYLNPELYAIDKAKEEYLCQRVDRNSLSQTFSLTGEPTFIEIAGGYEVIISGTEQKYTGKTLASTENVSYRVVVKKVVPTEINKYGLAIAGVERVVSQ